MKPFSIYLMENETSWYVGSAWNKTTAQTRYSRHLSGKGGARKLWGSIQGGANFALSILQNGEGETVRDAYTAEEFWISKFTLDDKRESLNVNLYPSRRRGWAESPESIKRRADKARGKPNVANHKRLIGQPRPDLVLAWSKPGRRDERAAAVALGMANMSDDAKALMHARQVESARKRHAVKSSTCRRGHDRVPENIYVVPRTGRIQCRICTNLRNSKTT